MKKIELTQGKYAIVDDDMFEFINQYKWHYKKDRVGGYATRANIIDGKRKGLVFLHRLVNQTPEGMETDHIDGNKLNCQRYNLRTATGLQNRRNRPNRKNNRSGYKGVYWHSEMKKWAVQIRIKNKAVYLGCFESSREAAQVYNKAAIEYFGEFAYLNRI